MIFPNSEHNCASGLEAPLRRLYFAADHDLSLTIPLVSGDTATRIPIYIRATPYCSSNASQLVQWEVTPESASCHYFVLSKRERETAILESHLFGMLTMKGVSDRSVK